MKTSLVSELEIDSTTKSEIAQLLASAFPDTDYNNRHYFKQLPHYRLLLRVNNSLAGHLGIDYRVMNLNGDLKTVLGVIDLAVHRDFQNLGIGTNLMKDFDKIANNNLENVDFTFLVTDRPAFYAKLGYKSTALSITWLKLNQGYTLGTGKENIKERVFMYKQIGDKPWKDGALDMLGYMY